MVTSRGLRGWGEGQHIIVRVGGLGEVGATKDGHGQHMKPRGKLCCRVRAV